MTAQVVGTNFIRIAFAAPRQTNGPLLGYQFAWQEVSGLKLSNLEVGPRVPDPGLTNIQIDGLKPNQTYRAYLWAYNSAGNGENNLLDVTTSLATRMFLVLASLLVSISTYEFRCWRVGGSRGGHACPSFPLHFS